MIQTDGTAPYAPPKSVMDVVHRYRDKGMQTPFDLGVLGRIGISSGLAPRVLQALRLLDLIDGAGEPTKAMEALRRAPTEEFEQTLAEIVRSAYSEVFNFVHPGEDSIDAISDAFRSYTPPGQRNRMVTLFVGLCREAGIIQGKPQSTASSRAARPDKGRTAPTPRKETRRRNPRGSGGEEISGVPPQLAGLLRTLPNPEEGWTSGRRDQFIAAFSAIIDYTYPLREALPSGESEADAEGGQI